MADKGWVSVYRQIQDCWVWKDKPFAKGQAWIDLLLLANHRPKSKEIGGEIKLIERGQFHTSTIHLGDRWGWDRRKVSRFLDVLESDGMLVQERTRNGTTLTIVNYGIYQLDGTTNGTTDGTTLGTTDGTQTINKQINKEKNINNKAKPKSIDEVAEYCRERGHKVDPQKWWDYYSANGWKVGRNSMKDWKASVRTWEKNSYEKPKNKFAASDQRGLDQYADFIAKFE